MSLIRIVGFAAAVLLLLIRVNPEHVLPQLLLLIDPLMLLRNDVADAADLELNYYVVDPDRRFRCFCFAASVLLLLFCCCYFAAAISLLLFRCCCCCCCCCNQHH